MIYDVILSVNPKSYLLSHDSPYSIVTTYDQGTTEYMPPFPEVTFLFFSDNPELFEFSLLIALALLSFAIALRRKKRSKSKFASDILADLMKVRNELNNNHKSDPNGIILRLHTWGSDTDNERQIVSDYKDYQKIDDFYSGVR
jgi:hypothetical protein